MPNSPASPATARLAVFFDGTNNTPKDRTNVWRTHELLAEKDANGIPQFKKYIVGVGTEFGEYTRGSIFGTGVARKIREGYQWLVENYQDGAEIYVFGFSRGAFSARSLVQLIATCGLTRKAALKDWSVSDTFAHYEKISRQVTESVSPIWRLRYWQKVPADSPAGWAATNEDTILMDDSKVRVVKVRMAGLWDTVGAMGSDFIANQGAEIQKSAEHNVRPTKAQEYGYHALAIDEHRSMFDITLWRTFVTAGEEEATLARYARYYEQRWFVGAHSDVGGGYGDDRLPDHSLAWMMTKAKNLGLEFTHYVEPQPGSWLAPVHDSFEAFVLGLLNLWGELKPGDQRNYRPMSRAPRPVVTRAGVKGSLYSINEQVDESVLWRFAEDATYRPPGLVEFLIANPSLLPAGTTVAQRTQRVYAAEYWNCTGVYLRANEDYRIKVVPNLGEPLRDASHISPTIAGEDWNTSAHNIAAKLHGKRMDSAPWFALIATVDKKHPHIVSRSPSFRVPVSGELLCYFNDVQLELFYKNNSGWVVLEVERVSKAPPVESPVAASFTAHPDRQT